MSCNTPPQPGFGASGNGPQTPERRQLRARERSPSPYHSPAIGTSPGKGKGKESVLNGFLAPLSRGRRQEESPSSSRRASPGSPTRQLARTASMARRVRPGAVQQVQVLQSPVTSKPPGGNPFADDEDDVYGSGGVLGAGREYITTMRARRAAGREIKEANSQAQQLSTARNVMATSSIMSYGHASENKDAGYSKRTHMPVPPLSGIGADSKKSSALRHLITRNSEKGRGAEDLDNIESAAAGHPGPARRIINTFTAPSSPPPLTLPPSPPKSNRGLQRVEATLISPPMQLTAREYAETGFANPEDYSARTMLYDTRSDDYTNVPRLYRTSTQMPKSVLPPATVPNGELGSVGLGPQFEFNDESSSKYSDDSLEQAGAQAGEAALTEGERILEDFVAEQDEQDCRSEVSNPSVKAARGPTFPLPLGRGVLETKFWRDKQACSMCGRAAFIEHGLCKSCYSEYYGPRLEEERQKSRVDKQNWLDRQELQALQANLGIETGAGLELDAPIPAEQQRQDDGGNMGLPYGQGESGGGINTHMFTPEDSEKFARVETWVAQTTTTAETGLSDPPFDFDDDYSPFMANQSRASAIPRPLQPHKEQAASNAKQRQAGEGGKYLTSRRQKIANEETQTGRSTTRVPSRERTERMTQWPSPGVSQAHSTSTPSIPALPSAVAVGQSIPTSNVPPPSHLRPRESLLHSDEEHPSSLIPSHLRPRTSPSATLSQSPHQSSDPDLDLDLEFEEGENYYSTTLPNPTPRTFTPVPASSNAPETLRNACYNIHDNTIGSGNGSNGSNSNSISSITIDPDEIHRELHEEREYSKELERIRSRDKNDDSSGGGGGKGKGKGREGGRKDEQTNKFSKWQSPQQQAEFEAKKSIYGDWDAIYYFDGRELPGYTEETAVVTRNNTGVGRTGRNAAGRGDGVVSRRTDEEEGDGDGDGEEEEEEEDKFDVLKPTRFSHSEWNRTNVKKAPAARGGQGGGGGGGGMRGRERMDRYQSVRVSDVLNLYGGQLQGTAGDYF